MSKLDDWINHFAALLAEKEQETDNLLNVSPHTILALARAIQADLKDERKVREQNNA